MPVKQAVIEFQLNGKKTCTCAQEEIVCSNYYSCLGAKKIQNCTTNVVVQTRIISGTEGLKKNIQIQCISQHQFQTDPFATLERQNPSYEFHELNKISNPLI